jgi:hypothetical protein
VVALIARRHVLYDAFVVTVIAMAGIGELAGMGLLAAGGVLQAHLVGWLPGPIHLLAAAVAAMSAVEAPLRLHTSQPPPRTTPPAVSSGHAPAPARTVTTASPR